MALETRKHAKVVKETLSENHDVSFNGALAETRPHVVIKTDETLTEEDQTITITNS
jgi:hypothetical protein